MDKESLKAELEALEAKWEANLKTKHHAGGNSKDNERMLKIRTLLDNDG